MFSQSKPVTKNYSYTDDIYMIYKKYSSYVSKLQLKLDTKEWRLKHIRGFLYYISQKKIKFEEIKISDVYDYMNSISSYSSRTKEHRAVCIRMLFNWAYKIKKSKFKGNNIFPKIKCHKESKLISYYSNKDITKVINSVNINVSNGKRDLIIILLFARLGLRPRDVKNLKFENISWKDNTLYIRQSKTNKLNVLPMSEEIRYALIDYIKSERVESDLTYVFLKNKNETYNDHLFYVVVNKYFIKSGININNKKHGPYAFRHSLGTSLLNDSVGIFEISNILGHANIDDAKAYVKVDYNNLKKISLEVPLWEN